MFDLLPNEILLDFLLLLDLPTLINFLVTQSRLTNLYHAQLEYFWTRKYSLDFISIIPDQLASSYYNKYKLCRQIANPVHKWTLIKVAGTDCCSLAVFNAADVADVADAHRSIAEHALIDQPVDLLSSSNPDRYVFKGFGYQLVKVPVYKSLTSSDDTCTSFGYLEGGGDYYDIIANFIGFSEEQMCALLAFLYNLRPKEANIAHFISDMLVQYNPTLTEVTAQDVEEAFAASKISNGLVKFVFNSVVAHQ